MTTRDEKTVTAINTFKRQNDGLLPTANDLVSLSGSKNTAAVRRILNKLLKVDIVKKEGVSIDNSATWDVVT